MDVYFLHFAVSFYEQNEGFDPSELKGVNAFDECV